jgi:hypothetical protein
LSNPVCLTADGFEPLSENTNKKGGSLTRPPFVIYWLPGRDAQQNFFSHQFVFSTQLKVISPCKDIIKNQAVKPKKKLSYASQVELAMEWQKEL